MKAVLFDLGDTLWHFPKMPAAMDIRMETMRRISAALEEIGVPMEGDLRFLGREIRLGVERADRAAYESDCVSPDFNEVVRQIANRAGNLDLTYEQGARIWDAWNLGGLALGRAMFEDAFPMLDWLRDHGFRIGCVTNRVFGGARFAEELRELGLDKYFESVAVSCDLGYMKPHEKCYQHALDEMGLAPEECVMVGDSLKADVQGAQTLGMTSVWRRVRKPDPPYEPEVAGQGPHGDGDVAAPATRAQTGRALGNYADADADGASPDFTIWTLWELTELPILTK
jgi:HAD superfamily hydrolase (TIGR01549 family)